tara:strand:+ start:416 stop:808 length:393 start_codon:yes stop_codon:yes gene_type:complete
MLHLTGKILVLILSLFSIFLGICAVLGIQIYFPFYIAEGKEIPYHRMQSVRVAVFITFSFYGILYLINSIKEVYPIHFLKVFMISFGLSSIIFSFQAEAGGKEIILAIFYLCCGLVFHLISKPALRKYFT